MRSAPLCPNLLLLLFIFSYSFAYQLKSIAITLKTLIEIDIRNYDEAFAQLVDTDLEILTQWKVTTAGVLVLLGHLSGY